MSHYVYLVRHGEQQDAEHGVLDTPLSERGKRQVELLAERLRDVPFSAVYTSPLDRASQTAEVLAEHGVTPAPQSSLLLYDCVPSGLTDDTPPGYERFFAAIDPSDVEAGEAQMADAADTFLARSRDDQHTLLISHNFVIGALVQAAMELPSWRWLAMNCYHASLTILRIRTKKPAELLVVNDAGHLPGGLRTGAPLSEFAV